MLMTIYSSTGQSVQKENKNIKIIDWFPIINSTAIGQVSVNYFVRVKIQLLLVFMLKQQLIMHRRMEKNTHAC